MLYLMHYLGLCNNHTDYQHVKISKANLNEYKENDTPVDIIYQHSLSNKVPEGTSVFDRQMLMVQIMAYVQLLFIA